MQIAGIIVAGGKSKRMGTDKTFVELDGVSLLERMTQILQPVCNEVIISSNNPRHKKYGYEVVFDEIKNCGPIGGIYSSLKKSTTAWNFVVSVDSPFIEQDFINHLISEINAFDAVVPIHKKGKEPLIALYHKNSLIEIEKRVKAGNYKMYDVLNSLNTKFVESAEWIERYPKLFHNINRPEDLS